MAKSTSGRKACFVERVVWRARARLDVQELYDFLFEKSPQAAQRAAQLILDGATLLETSPRLGRPLSDGTERRELVLSFGTGAYILRYMLTDDGTVVILRVRHSRERRTS